MIVVPCGRLQVRTILVACQESKQRGAMVQHLAARSTIVRRDRRAPPRDATFLPSQPRASSGLVRLLGRAGATATPARLNSRHEQPGGYTGQFFSLRCCKPTILSRSSRCATMSGVSGTGVARLF
jgi:hypothetical protein